MFLIGIIRGKFGRPDGDMIELALDPHVNKTGDIWHICIEVILLLGCSKHYLSLIVLGQH
jgi:hypothetical protein